MPLESQLIVAVHGLSPWEQVELPKLRTIESTLRRMGEVSPDHKVKLPILFILPDEKISFINGKRGLNNPYKPGQRRSTSIDEALIEHKRLAPHHGDGKGVPLVLTPEFRRYQTRRYESRRLDLTNMYHTGPNLSATQKRYLEEQEKISPIYLRFAKIYKTILRALRVASHPKCYTFALEAAAQEGHFPETFVRGIRGMRVEAERALKTKETQENANGEYGLLQNIRILKTALKQRLERARADTQMYDIMQKCLTDLGKLSGDNYIAHSPRISNKSYQS